MTASVLVREEELEQELAHVRDLVVVRDALRARGATADELREYAAVIATARGRLAQAAKRTYPAAA
jgi:alkylhydroperoxidase/carboxymuconolactone decarboxylase family protein YurZ